MTYIIYNGDTLEEKKASISPNNRAFRYADGFFETMRFINGSIILQDLHFERLYASLDQLKFDVEQFPGYQELLQQIIALAKLNSHLSSSRVRLTIFAGNGGLNDAYPRIANHIIQTSPLSDTHYILNQKGISIDFFRDAVKPSDNFSHIKSNNFLAYVMASLWAKENGIDDALLLNSFAKIADATIANIFIVKDGCIQTPPLSDGPVNGVMRKYLLQCLKKDSIPFKEISLTMEDVLQASEVFLTNAVVGIKWVEKLGASNYTSQTSNFLYTKYVSILNP